MRTSQERVPSEYEFRGIINNCDNILIHRRTKPSELYEITFREECNNAVQCSKGMKIIQRVRK
jgi:hypothetical protein